MGIEKIIRPEIVSKRTVFETTGIKRPWVPFKFIDVDGPNNNYKIINLFIDTSMDLNINRVGEYVGFLVAFSGIIVLFARKIYSLGILILIVLLSLLIYLYMQSRKPLKYKEIEYDIKINDEEGKEVIIDKISKIKVLQKNITKIVDQNYAASGEIEFLGSNIGKLEPFRDGGSYSVATKIRDSLEKGEEYKHVLTTNYKDTFIGDEENFSIRPGYVEEKISAHFHFPEDRKCESVEAYAIREGVVQETDNPDLYNQGKTVKFEVESPDPGSKYVITWSW